jgi:hypothetical protein
VGEGVGRWVANRSEVRHVCPVGSGDTSNAHISVLLCPTNAGPTLHQTFPGKLPHNVRRKQRTGPSHTHAQPWVVIWSLIVLAPAVTSAEFFSRTGDPQVLE